MAITIKSQVTRLIDKYRNIALLLDFDGTMVDLVPNPDEVHVPSSLVKDIERIVQNKDSAFAVVTGRTIEKLDQFLGTVRVTCVGCHGAELRLKPDGPIERLLAPMPDADRIAAKGVSQAYNCIFEDKTYSLSMHLPPENAKQDLSHELALAFVGTRDKYLIRKVGRTYEVLQKGTNKGTGIAHLMQQSGFIGRMPVYIGDDAYIDESLDVLAQMGGVRIPIGHMHSSHVPHEDNMLNTTYVRDFLAKFVHSF